MNALEASRAAWEEALRGKRNNSYKDTLLLVVLDRLDRAIGTADHLPDDASLSAQFDEMLEQHGALEGPGRYHMPRKFMSTHAESKGEDRVWDVVEGGLEPLVPYRAVLETADGREWLRKRIVAQLPDAKQPTRRRLAALMQRQSGYAERLAELWGHAKRLPEEFDVAALADALGGRKLLPVEQDQEQDALALAQALKRRGLLRRGHRGKWVHTGGELTVGESIRARIAVGDTSMATLTTEQQRRQGQDIFSSDVLDNFDSFCAFCDIGVPTLLDGAHILSVKEHPDRGLDVTNGICLCATHHRAFDRYYLGVRAGEIVTAPELKHEIEHSRAKALLTLAGKPLCNKPAVSVDPTALAKHANLVESA